MTLSSRGAGHRTAASPHLSCYTCVSHNCTLHQPRVPGVRDLLTHSLGMALTAPSHKSGFLLTTTVSSDGSKLTLGKLEQKGGFKIQL